jgi:hypothetical protein
MPASSLALESLASQAFLATAMQLKAFTQDQPAPSGTYRDETTETAYSKYAQVPSWGGRRFASASLERRYALGLPVDAVVVASVFVLVKDRIVGSS